MECVKCVLQAKEMRLNEKGVCNFCQEYEGCNHICTFVSGSLTSTPDAFVSNDL